MRYMGGKARASKIYAPIFNSVIKKHNLQNYYEPFCGSLAMAEKVVCDNVFCNDLNKPLIDLYKGLQNGWVPPIAVSEKDFKKIKESPENYDSKIVAFAALCGFGGKWFGSYSREMRWDKRIKHITITGKQPRNYSHEVFKALMHIKTFIQDYRFSNYSYNRAKVLKKSLIYCDPPYANTEGYNGSGEEFNTEDFWKWVRKIIKKDVVCFVSEHRAPEDFISIAAYNSNTSLSNIGIVKKHCEKLFIHKSQIDLIR